MCAFAIMIVWHSVWPSDEHRDVCVVEGRVFIENWLWVSQGHGGCLIHPVSWQARATRQSCAKYVCVCLM